MPTTLSLMRAALLSLALACAQALALDHEIGHGLDADQHACTTCSVTGGLKHLATAPEVPVAHAPVPVMFKAVETTLSRSRSLRSTEARAPPSYS